MICSILTKNKTTASTKIIEMYVTTGKARGNIDRARVRIPICTILRQLRDLWEYIAVYNKIKFYSTT